MNQFALNTESLVKIDTLFKGNMHGNGLRMTHVYCLNLIYPWESWNCWREKDLLFGKMGCGRAFDEDYKCSDYFPARKRALLYRFVETIKNNWAK